MEGWVVPLQNKVIGQNHVQNPSFEYKAWYKSRYQIFIGNNVTPKTDPGDYIIENSGNITVYAGVEIVIKDGFHAKPGSTFHAFIQEPSDCYVSGGKSASTISENSGGTEKILLADEGVISDEKNNVILIPNPNTGNFIFSIEETHPNGQLYVYGLDGKIYYEQSIYQSKTALELSLAKGVYLVVFISGQKRETAKLVIQ
ncbi:MAG: T9SS type A sorting domain-containing protein [Crocinitomicaceae bacterium]|nr:T9SS type A sorting domain-containing protein [Crocinitomicaceae bacterium]